MKRYIIAAIIAVFAIASCPYAYAETDIYRMDFTVHDEDRTFSAALGGIVINVSSGIIAMNNQNIVGLCGKIGNFYITADEASGRFNVVLDGKSIYSGKTSETGRELTLSDCDSYNINSSGTIRYEKISVSSNKYNISDRYITGIGENISAEEIISNLKIDGNGTAKIVTKNGVTRSGKVKCGDFLLCTDMLGDTIKYTFPEADLGGIHSDFFNINLQMMTVENLPAGLNDEQIKGAIKSDKDFTAAVTAEGLVITASDTDYVFKKKIRPPKTSEMYYSECDDNDFLNWSSSAANIKAVYTDIGHGTAFEISPEQKSSNASMKRTIEHSGGAVVVSNDIKYNFEDPENHTRQFNAPIIVGNSDEEFYVRERRGELVYRNPDDDYLLDIYSENDTWHNIMMLIQPDKKEYSVYYDGVKKADGRLPQTFENVKYLKYTTNAINNAEGGKMYADNIAVFKPFVQLGAIEYGNGKDTSYNSENISDVTSLKLIFSNAEYNKINQSKIAESVSVMFGGESVAFNADIIDNTIKLSFDTALQPGEYKIKITNPETIYGSDGGSYEYSFNTGAKIKYAEAETDGRTVYTEIDLAENDLFCKSKLLVSVYDDKMNLCGTGTAQVNDTDDNLFVSCEVQNGIPHYVKIFAWSDFQTIRPLCDGYVKKLAEEK